MAINVSNPTSATGRKTADELLQGRYYTIRQDLSYLKTIASPPQARLMRSALPSVDPARRVNLIKERDAIIQSELQVQTRSDHDYPLKKHPDTCVPLCNLRLNDYPIRPAQINTKGASVSLMRRFGSKPGFPPLGLEVDSLLATLGEGPTREALLTHIHTNGTLEGFEHRLGLITAKITKSIHGILPPNPQKRMETLARLLPVDYNALPDWNDGDRGDLLSLLRGVKLTGKASAGAPYWRAKEDCMEQIFYMVEHVVTAIKGGTLSQLLKEQPELFVIECKNKRDRYEVSKLKEKTRPYFNPPAHFSILASFLFQGFSKALYKVGGPVPTCNAYGWSAAHGGISKLIEDVERRYKAGERGWAYAYGDDGDLYFVSGKVLYRVSPDIKQMDSCVDFDTLVLTFDYLKYCYNQAHGESRLWNLIIEALIEIFKRPRILVSGTQLYTKDPDGLMSGIVGTTVFDTVKAAVSYTDLLESHSHDPSKLMSEEYVSRVMLDKYGLRLKPGTWVPEPVNLNPNPAELDQFGGVKGQVESIYGSGKFLGIQYIRVTGPNKPEWIPWLPEQDWASCIVAPRMDENTREGVTAQQRTQFDRIRGYLTTGAVFNTPIREALHYWVDRLSPEAILLNPQGTAPPEGVLFGEEQETWEYPTPEFFPTAKWVFNIYASDDNQFDAPPEPLFSEEVMEKIKDFRQTTKKVQIRFTEDQEIQYRPFKPKPPLEIGVEMATVETPSQKLGSHWEHKTPERVKVAPQSAPITGIPYDLALEQTPTQALSAAINSKPSVDFLASRDDVRLRYEALQVAREHFLKLKSTECTQNGLVHAPTPGGVAGTFEANSALLMESNFEKSLTEFVKIQAHLSPSEAANKFINKNGYRICWTSFVTEKADPHNPTVKGVVLLEKPFITEDGRVLKESVTKGKQVWIGRGQKEIKWAFHVWINMLNKSLGTQILDKAVKQDWTLVDSYLVPYSMSEAPGAKQQKPPPALLDLECPTTVPVQTETGDVVMSTYREVNPFGEPGDLINLDEEIFPPPPEFASDPLPQQEADEPPALPQRSPRHSKPLPLPRARGRPSVVSSDDEWETFENAVKLPLGADNKEVYVPAHHLEEVLGGDRNQVIGSLENLDRDSSYNAITLINSLKTILKKATAKYKHNYGKQTKEKKPVQEQRPAGNRELPPGNRHNPGQPHRGQKRQAPQASRPPRDDRGTRSAHRNGGSREWNPRQQHPRARDGPPVFQGGRRKYF